MYYGNFDQGLALLSIAGLDAAPAKLRQSDTLRAGERVYTVGAPRGLELTLGEGLISNLLGVEDAFLIQTSAPISPGSSGGGLFDETGHLIGVTAFYLADSQNLNFALPVEWILELAHQPILTSRRRDRKLEKARPGASTSRSTPTLWETLSWLKSMLDRESSGVLSTDKQFSYEGCHVEFEVKYGHRLLHEAHFHLQDVELIRIAEKPVGQLWDGTFLTFRTSRNEPRITSIERPRFDAMLESEKTSYFEWHLGSVRSGTANDHLREIGERTKKAFSHAVKLCGGHVRVEPF